MRQRAAPWPDAQQLDAHMGVRVDPTTIWDLRVLDQLAGAVATLTIFKPTWTWHTQGA